MYTCPRPECTVAETGRCLLNNDPAACPERIGIGPDSPSSGDITGKTSQVLEKPSDRPRFPHSLALDANEMRAVTGIRYNYLAGILGPPKAGKTALLVSLYLMAANAKLDGYQIADCRTLMGIDEISRGARRWNEGQAPEEMTIHTELPDERKAGFLHLKLKRKKDDKSLDLLLPDLPGEWTNSMIDHKRTDRLDFLKSADVLWVTIDGAYLAKARQHVVHRTQLLLQRIKGFLLGQSPKIIIVISHLDCGRPEKNSTQAIEDEAKRLGLSLQIVSVASFSDDDTIAPGTGILDLLNATFEAGKNSRSSFWPDRERSDIGRYISRFRSTR
jgi:hypothetical protein